jgi:hypothetical protein
LALRIMALQVLQVALDESGGPYLPHAPGQHPILNDMKIITNRAEQVWASGMSCSWGVWSVHVAVTDARLRSRLAICMHRCLCCVPE